MSNINSELNVDEQEIITDTQHIDINTENVRENINLSKDKNSCDCDSVYKNEDSKETTEISKQSESAQEIKEKRVTFLLGSRSSDSEENEKIEAFDEDIPPLQDLEASISNLEKEESTPAAFEISSIVSGIFS